MSIRGRRPHSQVRRLVTPPASARAAVDVEIAETPSADAERLMTTFRVRAYSEARLRQRRAAAPEAAAHWGQVANLIARRASDRSDEPSTRTELDARVARRARELGVRPAVGFFEVDPLGELERVLAVRFQRFRLQFFGLGADLGAGRSGRNRDRSRGCLLRDPRSGRSALAAPGGPPALARSRGAGNLRAAQGRSQITGPFAERPLPFPARALALSRQSSSRRSPEERRNYGVCNRLT